MWQALEAAKAQGKARHIGVSNFNTHDLQTLAQTAKQPVEARPTLRSCLLASDYRRPAVRSPTVWP